MPISNVSSAVPPSSPPLDGTPDLRRLERLLPPLLSVIAGMVDVTGYLSLGKLFTAHVTGNLVLIAALVVRGGPPNMAQILAVPVFALAVAVVWLIAKTSGKRGPALAKPLLQLQFALLCCVLVFGVVVHPSSEPQGLMAGAAAMIAVSAMGCQFALLRLTLPGAPSTAVMTGNLTNTVLSLLDTMSRSRPLMEGAELRLKKTLKVVVGFFAGCVAGAAAVSWLGDWAWSIPVLLAGAAALL